ncbi:uncharacterized protein CDAR_180761 [Caerostris darwini]|uniref:Uncharacterized protein n=1 Tax=Caerostris darwini TaxID=1538125 RepID=A0AAV4QXW1_9ARAC|nr:uncharacterized protein CDAR_180761 [Caerostris darwini]
MTYTDRSMNLTVKKDLDFIFCDFVDFPLSFSMSSRIVFLNKITLKCIAREKARKERAMSIRLRMSGRYKIVPESDNEKVEELMYENFSRHFGANDRGQAMEEVPKPAPVKETKVPQLGGDEKSKDVTNPKRETISSIFRSGKRKGKGRKKKISKKRKKNRKKKIRNGKLPRRNQIKFTQRVDQNLFQSLQQDLEKLVSQKRKIQKPVQERQILVKP